MFLKAETKEALMIRCVLNIVIVSKKHKDF